MSKSTMTTTKRVMKTLSVILRDSDIKEKYLLQVLAVINSEDTMEKVLEDLQKQKKNKRKTSGPMKPRSAYIFFCKEKRGEVISENPGMKLTEVTSKLAVMWGDVKITEEGKKYHHMATDDKKRYIDEMEKIEPLEERGCRLIEAASEFSEVPSTCVRVRTPGCGLACGPLVQNVHINKRCIESRWLGLQCETVGHCEEMFLRLDKSVLASSVLCV